MRVSLVNQPTIKALKLAYSAASITVSGVIAASASAGTVTHTPTTFTPPTLEKDSTVPAQSFEVPAPTDTVESATTDADVPFSKTIAFADLKALPGFASNSQFMFGVHFVNGETVLHETWSRSFQTKRREVAQDRNCFYPLHISVPNEKAASFDDCLIFAMCAQAAFTLDNGTPTPPPYSQFDTPKDIAGVWPTLVITGPDNVVAAGTPFTVTYAWPDTTPIVGAEIWSDTTAGYVNRKRAVTDAKGQATFTVLPLALDKGESLRLKFGFRHFTGKVEKTLTVS